jgi:hypothetical protein
VRENLGSTLLKAIHALKIAGIPWGKRQARNRSATPTTGPRAFDVRLWGIIATSAATSHTPLIALLHKAVTASKPVGALWFKW